MRRPTQHGIFGVSRSPGLADVLAAGMATESAVRPLSMIGGLDLLPAGRPIPRTGDVASSRRMGELLGHASSQYGLVIVDSPPVLTAADAAGIATHPGVEIVLVVNRTTRRRSVTKALRKLELVEASVAGLVVNRQGRLTTYAY